MIQDFKGKDKIYIQKKIAEIFTQWIKFILPIPNTDSFIQQTANVLVQLMDKKFRDIISDNIGDVYVTLGFSNQSNANNLKKMSNPLKHIILNMVFYLCTPQDAISFNVEILQRYRIFKNREIFTGKLQDQHNILAIVEELNIKDLESQFSNVYRIPINTLQSKITVLQMDMEDDLNLKNVLAGIECIAAIMSTKLEKIPNLADTAKFRSRLAKTDSSRAAFIFTPTEFMLNEDSFRKPMEFYTFWDLLCGQYFQEYKTGIDIEHIVTSSRLQYMADFAVTFKEDDNNLFNFFLSIFMFALYSRFVQICVTNTCNRSAGDSVRWSKTIDEYKNLLTFVCTLYWAVEKGKMDECKIGEKTVRQYIVQMYTNSDIIHNKETGSKQQFLDFPTMIVPFKFLYDKDKLTKKHYKINERIDLLKITKDDPLRRNYEFVRDIGMYMNNYNKGEKLIPDFVKDIFAKRENVVKTERLKSYVAGEIELKKNKPTTKAVKPLKGKELDSDFGKPPQPNDLEMFQGLPSIATMERRIQRMDDLLLGIPYQKPLVQRLLEFNNEMPSINKTIRSPTGNIRSDLKTKSQTKTPYPSKTSMMSRFFNTKIIPQ